MHQAVTLVAKYFIFLSGLLIIWAFVEQPRDKKRGFLLVGLLGALFALALAVLGSHIYNNPRPFVVEHFTPYFPHAADNGFPSDHTLLAGFLAFLAFRYSRKFGIALLILALLIGAARVIAGVHHWTDIVGSFIFAAIGVWLASFIVRKIAAHKTKTARR